MACIFCLTNIIFYLFSFIIRDFDTDLYFNIIDYNKYLRNFKEDLSLGSTIKQTYFEGQGSGAVRLE